MLKNLFRSLSFIVLLCRTSRKPVFALISNKMLRWYSIRIAFVAVMVGRALSGMVTSDMIIPEFTGELTTRASVQPAIVSVYSFA